MTPREAERARRHELARQMRERAAKRTLTARRPAAPSAPAAPAAPPPQPPHGPGDVFRYGGAVRDRLALGDLLNGRGLTGAGAEIGVWRGDYSDWLLDRWRGGPLYLVDPWCRLDGYDDVRNRDFCPADWEFARGRFRRHGGRAVLLRMTSAEAAARVHRALDFVYIDANHAYAHVAQDIALWWPKLRPGGVLAGHDVFSLSHPGVTAAVAEFCLINGLAAELVCGEHDGGGRLVNAHSWYVIKPGL